MMTIGISSSALKIVPYAAMGSSDSVYEAFEHPCEKVIHCLSIGSSN